MELREDAKRRLQLLGAAPIFVQSYEMARLPENLDVYFGPPEEFFLNPHTLLPYTGGKLLPILDDGNFGIVTFYDPDKKALVQKSVETPDQIYAQFANWQQYLADLLIRIAETVDEDDQVRRLARLLGFKHIDVILAALSETPPNEPHEHYLQRRAQLISKIEF